ncbi:SGNH/GDSL hydrolase family protein [Clostridium thermarum]|uniref:SGNH/GDSL hydrolase family protein n=1 Tax=Clostridium thermarum TaxID=1716543 RepID=UPI00111DAE06|nr:SGNH/GDSL hydrolase family protein [Clostridium thermarum]
MDNKKVVKINKAVIYGDSISTRNHGDGGYEALIKEKLNINEIYNHAIGSSGISKATPNSLVGLLDNEANIHKDADLIILWHGTNDWYWGAPLGDASSNDENTFYGAVRAVINKLRKLYPGANIVYLTPIFRYEIPDKCAVKEEGYISKNSINLTLIDYYEAIMELSVMLGFTTIDMRKLTNFHYYNAEKYFEDYIHPNEVGYKRIADIIASKVAVLSFD